MKRCTVCMFFAQGNGLMCPKCSKSWDENVKRAGDALVESVYWAGPRIVLAGVCARADAGRVPK